MRIAAIDVGTNSIHLLVVASTDGQTFEVLDREKARVKLGAGVFETGQLSPRAFAEGLRTLQRYALLVESLGVHHLEVLATSALREAANGTNFIDAVQETTGLAVEVVSGWQEAALIHRAVRHAVELGDAPALVINLGGGSVEVLVGDRRNVRSAESLRLGSQRLLDARGGQTGPLSDVEISELVAHIRATAGPALQAAVAQGITQVIGTSGTWRALGDAIAAVEHGPGSSRAATQRVRRRDLARLARQLAVATEEGRSATFGISPQRADAIHLAALVAAELMVLSGIDELTVSDASLRDGAILNFLDDHTPAAAEADAVPNVRQRAVQELANKYGRGDLRDEHIANLCMTLFDQLFSLHELGAQERELLHAGAMLHAVGQQIGFEKRHEHSDYVIRHARLRGFSGDETTLLGLIARHHRDAPPSKKQDHFRKLSKSEKRVLRLLSAILRLAVALDRGQTQQVKRVEVDVKKLEVVITVHGPRDLELELWAARGKLLPLAKALDRRVRLRRGDGEVALPSLPVASS